MVLHLFQNMLFLLINGTKYGLSDNVCVYIVTGGMEGTISALVYHPHTL